MGLRALSEELGRVLGEDPGRSSCCGSFAEALRALAEESGLQEEALLEAMQCDPGCRARYTDKDGTFKGGSGTAAENCKKMFSTCCKGVKDPEALCAHIGRRAGKN